LYWRTEAGAARLAGPKRNTFFGIVTYRDDKIKDHILVLFQDFGRADDASIWNALRNTRYTIRSGEAELIIAKQRNGPTGEVKLTFLKQCTRFENRAVRTEPEQRIDGKTKNAIIPSGIQKRQNYSKSYPSKGSNNF
jgi:DnaB-like helicase C terminal domain